MSQMFYWRGSGKGGDEQWGTVPSAGVNVHNNNTSCQVPFTAAVPYCKVSPTAYENQVYKKKNTNRLNGTPFKMW